MSFTWATLPVVLLNLYSFPAVAFVRSRKIESAVVYGQILRIGVTGTVDILYKLGGACRPRR